ncbi:MAG: hypothetical protein ACRDY6_21950 [Acidimicrobiia bacterium]
MRKLLIHVILALAAVGVTASTAAADPTATVTFRLTQCELTIVSTKDISNFSRNGLKTEGFPDGTTMLVFPVAEGDVIAVKAGITTADFTVTGCLADNGDGWD